MDEEEFDRIMSEPYSKDNTWVVRPLAKPPIDPYIDKFLAAARKSFMENPGTPHCAKCLVELKLNEVGNICCLECGMEIK